MRFSPLFKRPQTPLSLHDIDFVLGQQVKGRGCYLRLEGQSSMKHLKVFKKPSISSFASSKQLSTKNSEPMAANKCLTSHKINREARPGQERPVCKRMSKQGGKMVNSFFSNGLIRKCHSQQMLNKPPTTEKYLKTESFHLDVSKEEKEVQKVAHHQEEPKIQCSEEKPVQ